MIIVRKTLEREGQNSPIESTGILQGNFSNLQFKFTLVDNGAPVLISDQATVKAIVKAPNGANYNVPSVTVAQNEVTISGDESLTNYAGTHQLVVQVGNLYTFTTTYNVVLNPAYSPVPISATDHSVYAKTDLSNVQSALFLQKGTSAGLLDANLANVNQQKLGEKVSNTQEFKDVKNDVQSLTNEVPLKADESLDNVKTNDLDRAVRLTNAYKVISNKHFDPITPSEVEEGIVHLELQKDGIEHIDWTQYNIKFMHVVCQFNQNNSQITLSLPKAANGRTFIISAIMHDYTGCELIIVPFAGDLLDGVTTAKTVTDSGVIGVAISFLDSSGYDWIPYPMMHDLGVVISDKKGNVHVGMQSIEFDGATISSDPNDNKKTIVNLNGIEFLDGATGNKFIPTDVQSLDKSIRIANLNGKADLSIGSIKQNEGIHVALGNDELLNSKFPNSKMYFSDVKVKGGQYVYADKEKKSYVLQDIDPQDDPNVSGGTTFLIAMYLEPSRFDPTTFSQDGYIELQLVDENNTIINNIDGNPMSVRIEYKAGQTMRPELYIGECQIKFYTDVHVKILLDFPTEEVIIVGSNTQLCIQAITSHQSSGNAILSFMAYTGYKITYDTRYYGYNSLNLAQHLVFPNAESIVAPNTTNYLGDGLYINTVSGVKLEVANYNLIVGNNQSVIPIFNITKMYSVLDTHYIKGKNYKVSTDLTNTSGAVDICMLRYDGIVNPPPVPKLEGYLNDQPRFTVGWTIVDTLFVPENISDVIHHAEKVMTVPTNAKCIAIIFFPHAYTIPLSLKIKDFEGDITPWFNKVIITNNSHISELYEQMADNVYKAVVDCPSEVVSYRYTANLAETKVPFGKVSGGDGNLVNDNSWMDIDSYDPHKVQGDGKVLTSGKLTIKNYKALIGNDTATMNNVEFYLVDKAGAEIPNSRIATTIDANRDPDKVIELNPNFDKTKFITLDVAPNDVVGVRMKSNVQDGFYMMCTPNGTPLFRIDLEFNELVADSTIVDMINELDSKANEMRFMDGGKEVYNKILEYDVSTGKMKVVDK